MSPRNSLRGPLRDGHVVLDVLVHQLLVMKIKVYRQVYVEVDRQTDLTHLASSLRSREAGVES